MSDPQDIDIRFERLVTMNCGQCGCLMDIADVEPFSGIECPECGNQDTVPARFGPYLLLNLISKGGMGGVYRAKDEALGRLVAIKVLLKSTGEDPVLLESFRREAQAAAKLNHPNIAQIYAFGETGGQMYIAMELVSGQRLDKLIDSRKPLPLSLVLQVGLDIAEGLKAASEIGLIHGDIKPENILLDEKHRAKLVDFGIAALVGQRPSGGVWGTPYYISPERVRGQKCDVRSDIYSLGATLYHAMAGQPPFEGQTPADVIRARLTRMPRPLRMARKDVPWAVSEIISRMLDSEPTRRYPTCASLISDLKKTLDEMPKEKEIAMLAASGAVKLQVPKSHSPAKATQGKVIRIKGHTRTLGGPPKPSDLLKHLGSPIEGRPPHGTHPPVHEEPVKRAPRVSGRSWLIMGVTVLAIVGGLGGFLLLTQIQKNREAAQAERARVYYLGIEKKKSEQLVKEFQKKHGELTALAATVAPLVTRMKEVVEFVIDEAYDRYEARHKPPEPKKKPPAPAGGAAPLPAGGERMDPDTPLASAEKDEMGRDAPFGAPSRAQFERERRARQSREAAAAAAPAPAAAGTATNAPAAAPAAVAPPPPPPPPRDDGAPEVIKLARKAVKAGEEINELTAAAKIQSEEVLQWSQEMADTTSPSNAVAMNAKITDRIESVSGRKTRVTELIEEARTALAAAEKLERAKKEEIAARQREADRRKQEEERQALIAAELQRARDAAKEGRDYIQKHQYAQAVDAAKTCLDGMTTEEGKQAIGVVIDRFARIVEMRKFVIDGLNSQPYRWGWESSRGPEDILGADEQGLKLRGGTVPWDKVTAGRFKKIFDHYMELASKVPPSQRAQYYLGYAAWCYENGMADKFREATDKAVATSSYAQEQVDRLFPPE